MKTVSTHGKDVLYHSFYEFEGKEFHKFNIALDSYIPKVVEDNGELKVVVKREEKKTCLYRDDNGLCKRVDLETGEQLDVKPYLHKLVNSSISRTRTNVRRILTANNWNYFGTLTFATEKRKDDSYVLSRFDLWRRWLIRHYPECFYIAFPERHQDGVLHFHLLLGGIEFNVKNPKHFKFLYFDKKNHVAVYQVKAFKYGRTNVQKINSLKKVATYCQKYVGKDCGVTSLPVGAKRYYCNRKINRVNVVKRVMLVPKGSDIRFLAHVNFYEDNPELKYYDSFKKCLFFEVQRNVLNCS